MTMKTLAVHFMPHLFSDVIKNCLMSSGIYINALLFLQYFLRAQQCGVPNYSFCPGAKQLISTAHPKKEGQEETEAKGEEKTGEEEGKAAT